MMVEDADRMREWAENLMNQPVGVHDDYGNLVVSLGIALQQQQQTQEPIHSLSTELNTAANEKDQEKTASQNAPKPGMLVTQFSQVLAQ